MQNHEARLQALAMKHPRFGHRRLHAVLVRQGMAVNRKWVHRLCKQHNLRVPTRRRRRRRGEKHVNVLVADHPNHVRTYDFVSDVDENGRKLRFLTVEDEFTREAVAIETGTRMPSRRVIEVLEWAMAERGAPGFIRSDNGPEFIAKVLMGWLKERNVRTHHIDPGSPWQNGFGEGLNGKFRDELLNIGLFHHPDHARAMTKLWKRNNNTQRPHSRLGYATPAEFAAAWEKGRRPAAPAVSSRRLSLGRPRVVAGSMPRPTAVAGDRPGPQEVAGATTVGRPARCSGCSPAEACLPDRRKSV